MTQPEDTNKPDTSTGTDTNTNTDTDTDQPLVKPIVPITQPENVIP